MTATRAQASVQPPAPATGRRTGPPARRSLRTRQRSWGLAAVAGLLIVGFALAGAALYSNAGDKTSVLAVGQPVAKGEVLGRDDLVSVSVSGVGAAVPVADVDAVVGRVAAVDMLPDQLLTHDMVTDDPVPGVGETLVGLALEPSQGPAAGLVSGDPVQLVAVPGGSDTADSAAEGLDEPVVLAEAASVYAVEGAGTAGGQRLVTVVVDVADSARVATYAATGRVAVIEIPATSSTDTDAGADEPAGDEPTGSSPEEEQGDGEGS